MFSISYSQTHQHVISLIINMNNSLDLGNKSGTISDDACARILLEGPPPATRFQLEARIVICTLMVLITLVAILDNSLVIMIVCFNRSRRTKTNILVFSLAVADLLIALGPMPLSTYLMYTSLTWHIGDFVCLLLNSFDVYLCTLSIFHVSFMAIDRCLSVSYPFFYERVGKKSVILMLTTSWIAPIGFSFLPIMSELYRIGLEDWYACALPLGSTMGHCTFFANKTYSLATFMTFVICLIIIMVCYLKIFYEARKQAVQIRTLSVSDDGTSGKSVKQELKAAKTIGIILVAFCVCWLPSEIVTVANPFLGYKISDKVYGLVVWLGYVNSMLNPLIYYFSNRSYKESAKMLLLRLRARHIPSDALSMANIRHR
uniref:5-hydroxytryptamine receptor 4B-like protein n=1 Tax=Haliotis discus hannai TaxID=42344 RepID=A0A5J6RKI0_HALDH|nr:5-hydroxytryptamine receptor 4B-like protein [Haliotis discus hannai]